MGEIYAAKTNHITNPVGYALKPLVFSWKVKGCKGQEQRHARIVISKEPTFTTLCFDTGEAALDSRAARVEFDPQPYTRYYWKVLVATDAAETIESDVQFFETAKMEEPWTAQWITCDSSQQRHPIFSKRISPTRAVARARLYICGLGLYEAYFLGETSKVSSKIGDEYLTPYCNNYAQWIQYQTYDVTEQVSEGGMLSILLGNGWYKGRFGFSDPERKEYYGSEWKLIAEIHIAYQDGTNEVVGTDETWSVKRSNLWFSNIYDGERRDDTLPPTPECCARIAQAPKGRLMERLSIPVKAQMLRKPVALIHTPRGEEVFDLGQEITGIFQLRVREPAGTTIRIQTGEVLQDGCFYNENLRTALSEYIYVSDGKEKTIVPHFTYYGYRYVKVSGVSNLLCEDFTAIVLHSDYESIGNVKTGNALVNQLISNVEWGMRGNFLDVPTDCPQRDERMGWTGDTQVFSATASYLADSFAFYRKYLYDLYQEQLLAGGMVPEVVPTFGPSKCSCAWGDAACIIPWNIYLFSGDKTILENQIESMKAWVDYIRKIDGDHHGWRQVFHYGDWLALDRAGAVANSVYGATDEAYIADIYYAASAQIVAKAAAVLGLEETRQNYQAIADRQWQVVKEEYFTATGRCAVKTQTGLVLALKYHLSDNERLTEQMLRKLLRDNKNKLNTGFVGTPLLCNVLTEHGMTDLAYRLLLNEEYPGWLHEVKLGATTVWERWNSLDENGRISSSGMNSLNHYSYGAVLEWIFRHVAGIDVTEQGPGGKMMRISPKVDYKLGSASAVYDSASGCYRCGWQIANGDQITVTVTVPFGAKAQVILPYAPDSVYHDTENPLFETVENGICCVKAGQYTVTYKAASPLKKSYSVDSTLEDLLAEPAIRAFLSNMMEVDMIPDLAYGLTLRQAAEAFAGGVSAEQAQRLNVLLEEF